MIYLDAWEEPGALSSGTGRDTTSGSVLLRENQDQFRVMELRRSQQDFWNLSKRSCSGFSLGNLLAEISQFFRKFWTLFHGLLN